MQQLIVNVIHADASGTMEFPGAHYDTKGAIGWLNVLVCDSGDADGELTVTVQDSVDGVTWANVAAFGKKTAALETERKAWGVWDATPVYMAARQRISYVIAGTTPDISFQVRLEPIY
jgi:hypothetical protein